MFQFIIFMSWFRLCGAACNICQLTNKCLTHWGRVTHICLCNLSTIGSVNGLSPGRRQAITWTNAGILLIGPLGTNFSEILIEIPTFSFKKMCLKVSSAKWRPFCLGPQCVNNTIGLIAWTTCITWGQPYFQQQPEIYQISCHLLLASYSIWATSIWGRATWIEWCNKMLSYPVQVWEDNDPPQ